jgi:hypothetical protein
VKDNTRRGFELSRVISVYAIFHILIYTFIVELIYGRYQSSFTGFSSPSEVNRFRYILIGAAIVEIFLIRFIRIYMNRSLYKKDLSKKEAISYLIIISLITSAICESVAIYGMILFFMGGNLFDFYPFTLLSLLLMIIYFPRYSHWMRV